MKTRILVSALLVLLLGLSTPADPAETDPLFNLLNNKLVLPYLRIGDEVYYLELNLVDPVNLLFQVSLSSIANITPTVGSNGPAPSAIFGTWSDTGFTLTLNSDGTYVFNTVATEPGCTIGTESGTYQWEPSTGVFVATILVDNNGECGFSDNDGLQRFVVDGNQLQYSMNNVASALASGTGGTGGTGGNTNSYALSITKTGNGSGQISSSQQPGISCGSSCDATFTQNTTVTLTATPDSGSYFFEWGGCPSVSGNGGTVCTVQANSNKVISAKFVSTVMTASIAGTGHGGIVSFPAGILCGTAGTDCSYSFPVGTTASLQATASSTSIFQNWSGGCTSTTGLNGSICNVTISAGQSANVTVTATFVASPLVTVRTVGTGSGNVTSSNAGINCGVFGTICTFAFPAGATASLTALAASGSTFAGWSGGCNSVGGESGNICNVLINAGQSNHVTVDASFTKNP